MVKINRLEIENVKRVKAVKVEPTETGLTIIGGKNRQGKTSVLDAIAWALGGERFRPTDAQREGSVLPPSLKVVLSNGLVVERKGKNSDLKVIDPSGQKGGQQLLNEFVEQLALDLPRFMASSNKEKAQVLLQIIGVGDQLAQLEQEETKLYNQRHTIGQIADQKTKFAKEQLYYPDAPKELISASDLIKQQQDVLARNGENQRKRERLNQLKEQKVLLEQQIAEIARRLQEANDRMNALLGDIEIASKSAVDLHDESTAELEQSIANIEEINRKVRANLDKDKAEEDAKEYQRQYDGLTMEIEEIRKAKMDLLNKADMPLPGLSVVDGELTYNGRKWDCMSGVEQLQASTAIVRRLNPQCGFVLLDKLEQMDLDTLREFNAWLESEGLQVIATRVSTGDECSIIIEDGFAVSTQDEPQPQEEPEQPRWKAGVF
jgi:DNA repair exonuclease SbcCD ATPase subunit